MNHLRNLLFASLATTSLHSFAQEINDRLTTQSVPLIALQDSLQPKVDALIKLWFPQDELQEHIEYYKQTENPLVAKGYHIITTKGAYTIALAPPELFGGEGGFQLQFQKHPDHVVETYIDMYKHGSLNVVNKIVTCDRPEYVPTEETYLDNEYRNIPQQMTFHKEYAKHIDELLNTIFIKDFEQNAFFPREYMLKKKK